MVWSPYRTRRRFSASAAPRAHRADPRTTFTGLLDPDLIRAEDLELLDRKAEQNTSTPSNPRPADAAAFAAMFADEIGA
ncbi:MAG TPA: hypothetical protein VMA97_00155 [Streptosporangiaceae bacterium]|nr:hypothetical protein [Streptosporangiaceae bacterium]